MIQRFEMFTTTISQIYKSVQDIKKYEMTQLGLKGTHVICLNLLNTHPEGLTGAEICSLSKVDKAGISRTLSELEKEGYIQYDPFEKRKYRSKALLTPEGKACALQVNELILNAVGTIGQDLSDEERRVFYSVLMKISANLTEFCDNLERTTIQ